MSAHSFPMHCDCHAYCMNISDHCKHKKKPYTGYIDKRSEFEMGETQWKTIRVKFGLKALDEWTDNKARRWTRVGRQRCDAWEWRYAMQTVARQEGEARTGCEGTGDQELRPPLSSSVSLELPFSTCNIPIVEYCVISAPNPLERTGLGGSCGGGMCEQAASSSVISLQKGIGKEMAQTCIRSCSL